MAGVQAVDAAASPFAAEPVASPGSAGLSSHDLLAMSFLAFPLDMWWFKPVCVLLALSWLGYRVAQVMTKPLDELASLLGFDIPATPSIGIANIKSDGALVHWTLPDKARQKSTFKFELHLNGTIIDAVSVHESAVAITGLQPNSFYVVRVALVNSHELGSKSAPVRFCTKPASSGDFFVAAADGHETDHDAAIDPVPRIRPFRGLQDVATASSPALAPARDVGLGLTPKRVVSGRRTSPVPSDFKVEMQVEDGEHREGVETVQHLTEKLDAVRRETDEAEKLAREEEEEERKQKEELAKERDELKAEVAEKEKASRNLKREVNVLERQNTAAQNERLKQERLLAHKRQERQKLKDDMVRWARELEEMKSEAERIRQSKTDLLAQIARDQEELRRKQAEEATSLHNLDSEVKEKTAEVKKLERTLKNSSPNGTEQPEPSLVQQYQQDAEDERGWQMHRQTLQQHYTMAYQKLESAKRFHAEQVRYLDSLRAERRRAEDMIQYAPPPAPQDRLPRRVDSQRNRHSQGHSTSESPRMAAFPSGQASFGGGMPNIAPTAFSPAPFLNIQNGMTIPGPSDAMSMSEEDRERWTGGALMSPGAGAELIPADLFSGDIDNKMDRVPLLPGLGSLPGLAGASGPSLPLHDPNAGAPSSPASAKSRPVSAFASPLASSQNLHLGSPDNGIDPDQRSVRSTRSNRATSGTGSRFSAIFGIKQRGKTLSDDGPMLSKASSMPRQDPSTLGLDSVQRKRNCSTSGMMPTGFGTSEGGFDGTTDSSGASSKRHFGLFSREKSGGWPSAFTSLGRRPASPRPGSTHSTELPRPSTDSNRWGVDTWPSVDSTGAANRGSPLAFGQGWNIPGQQPRLIGSRHPSRRPSVQYAASGPPEDILEDDDSASDAFNADAAKHLAPIGTKPPLSATASTEDAAKLNPNAKDFKSFFKLSKSKESTTPGSATANMSSFLGPTDYEDSPPNSRKSRDTRSLNTNESSIAESGRNSIDLALSATHSALDMPVASPSLASSSKESFMSKLTRKSSSSKFSLPTFRPRDKARLDGGALPLTASTSSAAGPIAQPLAEEDDEDALSASVGSVRASGSGRSWSSVLKLGKGTKKASETPSLSGLSLASGTEDGDVDELEGAD